MTEAVALGKGKERREMLRGLGDLLMKALRPLGGIIAQLELSFSLAEGRISVKRSKGAGA